MPQGATVFASALMTGAKTTHHNAFKAQLVERTLGAVLAEARAS